MRPSKKAIGIGVIGGILWMLDGFLRPIEWIWKRYPR